MLERSRQTVAVCDFAVHGLDERWAGSRWIGGWSWPNGAVGSLTLAFGDPVGEDRPHVRVTGVPAIAAPEPGRLAPFPLARAALLARRCSAQRRVAADVPGA